MDSIEEFAAMGLVSEPCSDLVWALELVWPVTAHDTINNKLEICERCEATQKFKLFCYSIVFPIHLLFI